MSITVKQNILTKNDCYKAGRTRTAIGMQLHTIGTAQNSASALASYWNQGGIQACVHYCVDAETPGLVLQFLPDERRAWADAGFGNNNLIAVELMESDYMKYISGASYNITNESKFKADITRAYNTAVEFFAMKCKQYGWNPQEKMSNGLYRVSSHDEGRRLGLSSGHVDPTHIWDRYGWTMDKFRADVAKAMGGELPEVETIKYKVRLTWEDEKSQKGAFIYLDKAKECADQYPGYSVFDLTGKSLYKSKGTSVDEAIAAQSKDKSLALLATMPDYRGLPDSKEDYIKKVSELAVKLYPYTRFLPSVLTAQACLENGMGVASDAIELTKRSNLIGQKAALLNSTWQDQTVWDGTSFVKNTPEVYNGVSVRVNAEFRVFPNYAYSLLDYILFITHAKISANKYKYRDVLNIHDPEKMITEIAGRGYCTSNSYPTSIMRIINQYNLTDLDQQAFQLLKESGTTTLSTPTTEPAPSPAPSTQKYYRVQVGAFTRAVSRDTVINDVRKKLGFSCFYESANGLYYVYCGSFQDKSTAKERVKELKNNGFDAMIKEVKA